MLIIRLRRIGKKKHPTYRIVVSEHRFAPTGRFVADIGFYDPHTKKHSIASDLATEWLNKGAKPSNTVAKLFKMIKIEHASVAVRLRKPRGAKKGEQPVLTGVTSEATIETPVGEVKIAAELDQEPADSQTEDPEEKKQPD